MKPRRGALPILLALALALGFAGVTAARLRSRTDIAALLPQGESPAARLLLAELTEGAAATLVLIGVDGATPAALARSSAAMTAALDRSGLFAFVDDGQRDAAGADAAFLFRNRYLLSPVTVPAAFETPSLRDDLARLLDALGSSAAPLAAQYGFADPPGAFLALARSWIGASRMRSVDGVWFAGDRDRALILARTRAGGTDTAAQKRVEAAIQAAFAAGAAPGERLKLAGPAMFALAAERAIRADVALISTVSTVLVAALLLWRFRSPLALAAAAVPVILGIAAGALAVQLVHGAVLGAALGFGVTMLGVTLDYPVLLIGHRKPGEAATGTLARIGRALALAVASAALGLTGMLFSGFPGLSELGLFAVSGIAVAALATRFLLPRLIVGADIAPASTGVPAWLARLEGLRRHRAWFALPVAVAAAYLLAVGGPRLERDLARLSPVPLAAQRLDAELRGELGAPEPGRLAVVSGTSAEAVLLREEALAPVLDGLVARGVMTGAEYASRYLPSPQTQLARITALPPRAVLAARLAEAGAGMPFRANAFDGFLDDVEASRAMPPLGPAAMTPQRIAARLAPLLFAREGRWFGPVAPVGLADSRAFAAALLGRPDVAVIDIGAETGALVGAYAAQAWRYLALGAAAVIALLTAGLGGPRRMPLVLAPVAAATLVTLAVLTAAGVRFSLFHIVALQLMVGIALDYALFYARRGLDADERARTFRTLLTCNALTLLSFGMLALCRTPLLRGIGITVALGVVAAMVFAFIFAGEIPEPRSQDTGRRR